MLFTLFKTGPILFISTHNQNLAALRKLSATPHLLGSSFRPAGPGRWPTEDAPEEGPPVALL